MATKGIVKTRKHANVKSMDGSADPDIGMNAGDYVYGSMSPTRSDIINFDHFYRVNGARINLDKLCKVSAEVMILVHDVIEPGDPAPTPEPTPTPAPAIPETREITDVWKDANGNIIATYYGVLTKR